MRAKLSVLRACRRLLKPGGRIAYYTIFISSGLSEAEYRRAARAGPRAVTSGRRGQDELLASAGFIDIREVDVTGDFLRTTLAFREARQRFTRELSEAEGAVQFAERQRDSLRQARAIEAGLLRRSLLIAKA